MLALRAIFSDSTHDLIYSNLLLSSLLNFHNLLCPVSVYYSEIVCFFPQNKLIFIRGQEDKVASVSWQLLL